jgi:hypothetical protein
MRAVWERVKFMEVKTTTEEGCREKWVRAGGRGGGGSRDIPIKV